MIDKYTIESYKDLVDEIDISSIRLNGFKEEKKILIKKMNRGPAELSGMSYDGMPHASEQRDMVRCIEDIQRLDNLIYLEQEILNIKEETLSKLENKINSLSGIEHKIAFLSAKGNSLKEIAYMLGYSYEHIRRVHANLKNTTMMLQTNSK